MAVAAVRAPRCLAPAPSVRAPAFAMLALDAPRASSPDPSSPSGSDASSPRSILRPSGSFMRKSAQGPSAASRDARRRAREAARRASLDAVAERAPRLEAQSSPSPSPAPAPDPEAPLDTPRGARPDRAPPTVATTVGATTPDGIENPPEPAPRADPPADPREPSPASPPSTPASLVATLANALADLERELIALAAPEPKRRSSSPGGIDEDGAGRAESNAEDARASVRDAARRASDLCADLGLADAAKRLEQPPSPDSVHQLDASFDSEDGEGWREKTNDARLGAEEEEEEDASAHARAREEDAPAGFPAASKASLALDFDAAADDAPAVATYLSSDDAGSIIGEDRVEDRFEDRFGDRRSDGFGRRAARVVRFSDCSLWAVHDIGSVRDLRREKRGGLVGAVAGWVKAETRALVSSLKGSGGAGEEEEAFKASIRRALRLGRRNMLENVDYNAAFSETADRATCTGGGGDGGTYYF